MCGFSGSVDACLVPRKRSFDTGRNCRVERRSVFAKSWYMTGHIFAMEL
jgi:hypothetical protein